MLLTPNLLKFPELIAKRASPEIFTNILFAIRLITLLNVNFSGAYN